MAKYIAVLFLGVCLIHVNSTDLDIDEVLEGLKESHSRIQSIKEQVEKIKNRVAEMRAFISGEDAPNNATLTDTQPAEPGNEVTSDALASKVASLQKTVALIKDSLQKMALNVTKKDEDPKEIDRLKRSAEAEGTLDAIKTEFQDLMTNIEESKFTAEFKSYLSSVGDYFTKIGEYLEDNVPLRI